MRGAIFEFAHSLVFGFVLVVFTMIALPQLVGQGANPWLLLGVFYAALWIGYLSPQRIRRRPRGRHRA